MKARFDGGGVRSTRGWKLKKGVRGIEKLVVKCQGVLPFRISGLCVVFVRDLGCAVENPPEGVVGVAPGVLGLLPPGV